MARWEGTTLVDLHPPGPDLAGTLKVGDQVQAFDPTTKKPTTQTVQRVFINHDTDLMDVTLALDPVTKATKDVVVGIKQQDAAVASHGSHAPPTSSTEMIHTTQKHPWLTTKGWIKAGDLHLGDHVLRLDGTTATVTKLHVIPGEEDMYDLTVSNIHTFAVGAQQFVVHNVGPACSPEAAAAQARADQLFSNGKQAADQAQPNNWFGKKVTVGVAQMTDPNTGAVQKLVAINGGSFSRWGGYITPLLHDDEILVNDLIGPNQLHAERLLEQYQEQMGMNVDGVGVSRPPCGPSGQNCIAWLRSLGEWVVGRPI
jgi:hypothetical protein